MCSYTPNIQLFKSVSMDAFLQQAFGNSPHNSTILGTPVTVQNIAIYVSSFLQLTDNVKARFITATEPLIAAYCSLYTSACVPISIVDGTATNR